ALHFDADQRHQRRIAHHQYWHIDSCLAVEHAQPEPLLHVALAVVAADHGDHVLALEPLRFVQHAWRVEESAGFSAASGAVEEDRAELVDTSHNEVSHRGTTREI